MNIIIKDDQGLDTALMMDGYSKDQRIEAKQEIRAKFRVVANRVFQDILERSLPEMIIVNMAISDNDELKGESAARLASYNVSLSRANSAVFTIREITVKTLLNHEDLSLFESTVIHEMFHAADKQMLEKSHKVFAAIRNDIVDGSDDFNKQEENANIALLKTLQVFNHYRAEGIAILGESLLMKSKFGTIGHATEQFCKVFELTMMRAQMKMNGRRDEWNVFNDESYHKAYAVAAIILLLVLGKRGDIDHHLAIKALDGLSTGNYEVTEEEIIIIMKAALALTLSGYIQGISNLGNQIAPIRPFLNFCGSLQQDCNEDNIVAYEHLLQQPKSEDAFNEAMNQIMGSCISEEELDELYSEFMEDANTDSLYPKLKEKVASLYSAMKDDGNSDGKRLAQWALTYFFDDEDIIHDDLSGVGLVDDITIIDYALCLLNNSQ